MQFWLKCLARLYLVLISQNQVFFLNGAEDRTRTRDPLFTKQLLYQLSYFGTVSRAKHGL
jgi:hypothetical protein